MNQEFTGSSPSQIVVFFQPNMILIVSCTGLQTVEAVSKADAKEIPAVYTGSEPHAV